MHKNTNLHKFEFLKFIANLTEKFDKKYFGKVNYSSFEFLKKELYSQNILSATEDFIDIKNFYNFKIKNQNGLEILIQLITKS